MALQEVFFAGSGGIESLQLLASKKQGYNPATFSYTTKEDHSIIIIAIAASGANNDNVYGTATIGGNVVPLLFSDTQTDYRKCGLFLGYAINVPANTVINLTGSYTTVFTIYGEQ